MLKRSLSRLGEWVKTPQVQLAVAVILVIVSVIEIIESFDEDLERLRLGIHHGLFILAISNALAALPDLVEGLERLEHVKGKKETGSGEHPKDEA